MRKPAFWVTTRRRGTTHERATTPPNHGLDYGVLFRLHRREQFGKEQEVSVGNWQVQELDGTSLSDWPSYDDALSEQDRIWFELYTPTRIRRTA
jgi:hypothetical protein